MTALGFAGVAALATVVRLVVGSRLGRLPWGTLAVNTAGAGALGWLIANGGGDAPLVWTVAGLGSLTTFSTVAAEINQMVDDERRVAAVAYLGLTLAIGIAAARLGLELGAPS